MKYEVVEPFDCTILNRHFEPGNGPDSIYPHEQVDEGRIKTLSTKNNRYKKPFIRLVEEKPEVGPRQPRRQERYEED